MHGDGGGSHLFPRWPAYLADNAEEVGFALLNPEQWQMRMIEKMGDATKQNLTVVFRATKRAFLPLAQMVSGGEPRPPSPHLHSPNALLTGLSSTPKS